MYHMVPQECKKYISEDPTHSCHCLSELLQPGNYPICPVVIIIYMAAAIATVLHIHILYIRIF